MINQITKMRLPDGQEVAFVDWSDQPLWSRAYMLHGFTDDEIPFFAYAPGDNVAVSANFTASRSSTNADTNVTLAGAFADTEEMLVYAIKPELAFWRTASGTPTELTGLVSDQTGLPMGSLTRLKYLHEQLVLQLWISQKVMLEGPMGYFNTGFGPAGQGQMYPTATTTQRTFGAQGDNSQAAVRSLAMPVYIGGTEKYRLTLSNFTGAAVNFGITEADSPGVDTRAVLSCRMILDGLYKRPVS